MRCPALGQGGRAFLHRMEDRERKSRELGGEKNRKERRGPHFMTEKFCLVWHGGGKGF